MRNHKHVQDDSVLIAGPLQNRSLIDKRKSQTHKFKCNIDSCEEVFNERSKLKVFRIFRNHAGNLSELFKRIMLLLQEHIRVHQGRFRCLICGIIEKSESELAEHKVLHENLDPLDCVLCKKRFKKKGALTRHMRIHVSFSKILKTSINEQIGHLYKLFFIHFQAGEKFYQCDKCGKEFVHKSSFNMHIMAHDNIRDKSCPHCPLKFRSTSHLNRHIRIHVIFFNISYDFHNAVLWPIFSVLFFRLVLNHMRALNADKDLPNDIT